MRRSLLHLRWLGLALLVAACSGQPQDDLSQEQEDPAGKADGVVRPVGAFTRTLGTAWREDCGFTSLILNTDRTYHASTLACECPDPVTCTTRQNARYRFTTVASSGNRYIHLYDETGASWYHLQYRLQGTALSLRESGTEFWFTMTRAGTCASEGGTCLAAAGCTDGTVGDPAIYTTECGDGWTCCLPFPASCAEANGSGGPSGPNACANGIVGDSARFTCTGSGAVCCLPPLATCGDVACGPGLECCNASCGRCALPDSTCSEEICE
jgi:hypothetical protein